jgi:hypothetical protein
VGTSSVSGVPPPPVQERVIGDSDGPPWESFHVSYGTAFVCAELGNKGELRHEAGEREHVCQEGDNGAAPPSLGSGRLWIKAGKLPLGPPQSGLPAIQRKSRHPERLL